MNQEFYKFEPNHYTNELHIAAGQAFELLIEISDHVQLCVDEDKGEHSSVRMIVEERVSALVSDDKVPHGVLCGSFGRKAIWSCLW